LNAPGSWHDARVAYPIYKQLLENTPDGYYLVADTAFPRGQANIAGRIVAQMKAGERITATQAEIEEKALFDREVISYRQTAEWGMRSIQGSFGRLRLPLSIRNDHQRADLLEICFRLHNLCTRRIGRNQIQSVYMPEWRKTIHEEEIWTNFENMLFEDQQQHDRVTRFYNHLEYE
jgi:DDE superfamily endonuclease